jgi:hypothetical protein
MTGDILDAFDSVDQFDVVFCFGILYNINDHMQLLSRIADFQPRWLVIDSSVSKDQRAVIEFHDPNVGPGEKGFPPPTGSELEGYPSRAGLDAMLSSFGWTFEYFDWAGSGLSVPDQTASEPNRKDVMDDYHNGRRVSVVVNCGKRHTQAEFDSAVQLVRQRCRTLRAPLSVITEVADEVGITPQALAVQCRKAERVASRHTSAMLKRSLIPRLRPDDTLRVPRPY